MEELYKFMNQSNATLDLKDGNELATEEGEPAEVFAVPLVLQDNICSVGCMPSVARPSNQPVCAQ